jgi:hypothetical protein
MSEVTCDVCNETFDNMKVGGMVHTARGTLRHCSPKCADKIRLTEQVQSFDGTPAPQPIRNVN